MSPFGLDGRDHRDEYGWLFDNVLVKVDAERAHHLGIRGLQLAGATGAGRAVLRSMSHAPTAELAINALGRSFAGPLGVAAGLDKNAVAIDGLAACGFAFVEVGTVTAQPQPGNPRPRLFRLPQDQAIINRMGFNNDGAFAVAERLMRRPRAGATPLGINIGKSKVVAPEAAAEDYFTSAHFLAPYADYLVVNVSSPNTPGLRDLQATEQLRPILESTIAGAAKAAQPDLPILVKIAPDLANDDILAVADLATELSLAGVIATNTTIGREGLQASPAEIAALGAGGLSGPQLAERSLEVLGLLRSRVPEAMTIISVGGVTSGRDVWERIRRGANLVQAYTAFIYGGPAWVGAANRDVLRELRGSGCASLNDAVGSAL